MIEKLKSHSKNEDSLQAGYAHSYGVSYMCALIAAKRNENIELATIAGMLHDIDKFIHTEETSEHHSAKGGRIAYNLLIEVKITTEAENTLICTAIRNHEDKLNIGTPFDEVLKDADVLAHGLFNVPNKNFRTYRWNELLDEFGLNIVNV
jgi:putative nucleotidyltransferase with HDIG domain